MEWTLRRSSNACVGATPACFWSSERIRPSIERRRGRLSEVVTDGAEHHRDQPRPIEIAVHLARPVDHHQRVRPDVAFRMPLRFLLAADERLQLRKQLVDDAEIEREGQADRWPGRLQQQFFDFAPDAFGRQVVERGCARHSAAVVLVQRELEPRRELNRAQHAQAVVAEGCEVDRAQQAALEVAAPVEGSS